jgi:hypothetical protein
MNQSDVVGSQAAEVLLVSALSWCIVSLELVLGLYPIAKKSGACNVKTGSQKKFRNNK